MMCVKGSSRSRHVRLPAHAISRRCISLFACQLVLACVILPASANAAAPTIVNSGTGCSGQTAWLVSCALAGEATNSANVIRYSVLAGHDAGKSITALITDDNWDSIALPTSVRAVTASSPTIAGGYPRSRVNLSYQAPTNGTGLSCGFGSGTRRTERPARIRAQDGADATSSTSSSGVKFVGAFGCSGPEDYAYLYGWEAGNFGNEVTPGSSVTFTYKGVDPDSTGNSVFNGVNWRLRDVRTGAVTAATLDCDDNGDDAEKSTVATFPERGAFVVEAELLDGAACTQNQNPGHWFPLGTADVNSATIPEPALAASRPAVDGSTTITLTPPTDPDSAGGGGAQIIEWDLDENTGNGVSGFETTSIAGAGGIFTANQTKTIDTTGVAPGLHTIRARVIDNGAMDAADSIRRTSSIATATFLVDTAPVANDQTVEVAENQPKTFTLAASDADGDALTFTTTDEPDSGVLSGTGSERTYTPNAGFAGTDSFTYSADDGFGGVDTATVTMNVSRPTAVRWVGGGVSRVGHRATITWRAGALAHVAGYTVLRARRGHARRVLISRRMIAGGTLRNRSRFRFVDRNARRGDRYFIREHTLSGRIVSHGPLRAR
jgi:hypothetical protein